MNTNDLYVRMLKDHPIQKEWKPKDGDKTSELGVIANYGKDAKECLTWLPVQDDWQDLLLQKGSITRSVKMLDGIAEHYLTLDLSKAVDVSKFSESETWTTAWCLFVSKEVYGLEWDWDKSEWRTP